MNEILGGITWEGNSLEILKSFPSAVRQDIGFALYQLQTGKTPSNSRPMKSIATGVFEIKSYDNRSWYRTIYYRKIKGRIFVLHCFEKKSKKTSLTDLNTAKFRLKKVLARRDKW